MASPGQRDSARAASPWNTVPAPTPAKVMNTSNAHIPMRGEYTTGFASATAAVATIIAKQSVPARPHVRAGKATPTKTSASSRP